MASKPWHTKEWIEKRAQIIKDACEQCGSEEKPLVIQHFRHSPPADSIKFMVTKKFLMKLYDDNIETNEVDIPELDDEEYKLNCCPKCNLTSISERKTMTPKYRCIQCHHTFDKHAKKPDLHSSKVRLIISKYRHRLIEKYQDEIQIAHERMKQTYDDYYKSLEDTATFCKKCAFLWDIKKKKLCNVCKKKYHSFGFKTCYDCNAPLREKMKKEEEEEEKFNKEMKRSLNEQYREQTGENVDFF